MEQKFCQSCGMPLTDDNKDTNADSSHNVAMIETERLILRPWRETDAEVLFRYASDPDIGPIAGWPPHTSVEQSLEIIRTVFSAPETYAVVLKDTGKPVGCCGIMFRNRHHTADMQQNEAEIGYWIGKPYWGKGLMPEAVKALLTRCFDSLHLDSVWCGYYEGNTKSKRVCEKCGFRFHHTNNDTISPLGDKRTEHFHIMTRDDYEAKADGLPPELVVKRIVADKSDYMALMLIGDESEDMVRRYIDIGDLYIGYVDGTAVSCIVAAGIDSKTVEVKNLAVIPGYRRRGLGRRMLAYIEQLYLSCKIYIGTGETPSTLRFYQSCGYRYSHRIPGFFTDNYPGPIVEEGVTLNDMIYLYKHL